MPDTPQADDPWADLYADLGVTERPKAAAPEPEPQSYDDEANANGDATDDDDNGDEEAEGDADGAPPELDEHGNPKKRKRRRRRRAKKKGDEAGPAPTLYAGNEGLPPRQAARTPVVHSDEDGEADERDEDEGEESVPVVSVVEGGTSEMTRELIANWNVPSWEEIVVGLYRPER